MKRYVTIAFIVLYLGVLCYGLAAHMLVYNVAANPGMYFIVWDMYCGWSAYETRLHIVAEGESGQLYELEPPWGSFHPFGSIDRRNYDVNAMHLGNIGRNILNHTEHEPIDRIFVIEESWSKKYNLSPELWQQFYDEPFEPVTYFRRRALFNADGVCLGLLSGHRQPSGPSGRGVESEIARCHVSRTSVYCGRPAVIAIWWRRAR